MILTFLVGNPYKPSFGTVTVWGVDPIDTLDTSNEIDGPKLDEVKNNNSQVAAITFLGGPRSGSPLIQFFLGVPKFG